MVRSLLPPHTFLGCECSASKAWQSTIPHSARAALLCAHACSSPLEAIGAFPPLPFAGLQKATEKLPLRLHPDPILMHVCSFCPVEASESLTVALKESRRRSEHPSLQTWHQPLSKRCTLSMTSEFNILRASANDEGKIMGWAHWQRCSFQGAQGTNLEVGPTPR